MTPKTGFIIVSFEYDKSTSLVQQDSGLFIPERYVIEEGDEDADPAWGVTTDRKAINPQRVTIRSGTCAGKRAFVHYGAFEVAKWLDDDTALIPEAMVLFFIDPIQCVPSAYLGEEVFTPDERTASGIILSTNLEPKEGVLINITHVPKNGTVPVGTTVVTIDSFQYDLTYEGKKHIKVDEQEIVGIRVGSTYAPVGNAILVEYLPDPEWERWKINNEDKREAYVDKFYPHLDKVYARTLYPANLITPEPKFAYVSVVSVGGAVSQVGVGDKLLIYRSHGCLLPNNQWIINTDIVLGVVK